MRLLELKRLMSVLQTQSRPNSSAKRRRSPRQQDGNPRAAKRRRHSVPELPKLPEVPKLPELPELKDLLAATTPRLTLLPFACMVDIWDHIHSLLPLPDAARAACVSRAFQSSWTRRPNLTFTGETLGLDEYARQRVELAQIFENRVYRVLKRHSGIGVKTFRLHYCGSGFKAPHLNRWLQIAVTPGIEEVVLSVPMHQGSEWVPYKKKRVPYNFPCSVLSNGSGNSIRHLHLASCAFHPVVGLARLTRLHLFMVDITGDELWCLLSNSSAMEEVNLLRCSKVIHLKIPCLLHWLNCLTVFQCAALKVIENKAPNLWVVRIDFVPEKVPVRDLLQVKDLQILGHYEPNLVHYARAKLPLIMPNLETLNLCSAGEIFNVPILSDKFLCLKNLKIVLYHGHTGGFSPGCDYFSLVSFLDACPVLENFFLVVSQTRVNQELISGNLNLRQMPEHRHSNIKNVTIEGFCSAKSIVELTCHILENATSLECLTLDPIYDDSREEHYFSQRMWHETYRGIRAIERYIEGKVPSTVKLNVKYIRGRCDTFDE